MMKKKKEEEDNNNNNKSFVRVDDGAARGPDHALSTNALGF